MPQFFRPLSGSTGSRRCTNAIDLWDSAQSVTRLRNRSNISPKYYIVITAIRNPKFHFPENVSFFNSIIVALASAHGYQRQHTYAPKSHRAHTSLCTLNNFPPECGAEFNDFVQGTGTSVHEVIETCVLLPSSGHSLFISNVKYFIHAIANSLNKYVPKHHTPLFPFSKFRKSFAKNYFHSLTYDGVNKRLRLTVTPLARCARWTTWFME